MLKISDEVKTVYPGVQFGIMVMDSLENPPSNPGLKTAKTKLEEDLQKQFGGMDKKKLREHKPISDYHNYYKRFKKTYHVLHQLESIANKKRSIPDIAPLVEAMFMAEVKNQLLTAGYDYSNLTGPFNVSLADGTTSFEGIGKNNKKPPQNDILFSDSTQNLGSIICGPNHANRITKATTHVLFAIYGVPGLTTVQMEDHFKSIEIYVRLVFPTANTVTLKIS